MWDNREAQITAHLFSGFMDCDTNVFLMELSSEQEWPHRPKEERVTVHGRSGVSNMSTKRQYLRQQYETWSETIPPFLSDESIVAVSRKNGRLTVVPPNDPLIVSQVTRLANYVWREMPSEYCQSTLSHSFSTLMKEYAPSV